MLLEISTATLVVAVDAGVLLFLLLLRLLLMDTGIDVLRGDDGDLLAERLQLLFDLFVHVPLLLAQVQFQFQIQVLVPSVWMLVLLCVSF